MAYNFLTYGCLETFYFIYGLRKAEKFESASHDNGGWLDAEMKVGVAKHSEQRELVTCREMLVHFLCERRIH